MDNKFTRGLQKYGMEIKNRKVTFAIYVVLRMLVIGVGIFSFTRGNYQNVFLCVLSLALFLLPAFVTNNFGIHLPETLEIIVLLFVFAAEILGEISGFYQKVVFWDSMLHTVTGFLAGAIGFALIDILNRNEHFKFQISPVYMALVAFCFSMTVGVMWEFFEFFVDYFIGFDMQKDTVLDSISTVSLDLTLSNEVIRIEDIENVVITCKDGTVLSLADYGIAGYLDVGIVDTMKDLFVNMIGAAVFSVFGFVYIKSRGRVNFVKRFVPTLKGKK